MKRWLVMGLGCAVVLVAALFLSAAVRLRSLELPSRDDASRGPSRIFSRPLVLKLRAPVEADALEDHLRGAGYHRVSGKYVATGEYGRVDGRFTIGARDFLDAAGEEPGGRVRVALSPEGRVIELQREGEDAALVRIEGAAIGSFLPTSGRECVPVRLDALPEHLVGAVLAIEDQRFFEHGGLDWVRIGGALHSNLRAGKIVEGGSTLTQQLVKNLYLSRERSVWRKLQEMPLAALLEWRLDKQEILEAYLNEVYLGQAGGVAIHGVGAAARHYFGKPPEALTLTESALLAGMLRGPTLYSPRRQPEHALERRNDVLERMFEQGRIDEPTYTAAAAQPLGVMDAWAPPSSARWFVERVRRQIQQRFADVQLERAGWRFDTTLDLRMQRIAERTLARGIERVEARKPALKRSDVPLQGALIAMEPKTGALLALVGGRSYGQSQFDHATDAHRQPGSLFKPVAVLAALSPEVGEQPDFTLASMLADEPFALSTPQGAWQPANHDELYRGQVTVREALVHSLNVPMVRLGQRIGMRRVVRAARRLGIESPLHAVPSLVLGTSETTLLEMTRAYAVLAARGWRADLRDLVAARDADGAIAFEAPPQGSHAVDPALAYVVTAALRGVVDRGTGGSVRGYFYGPLAGKTGTTDEYRDAWFVGYTPDFVAGVWVGFDDGASLRQSASRAAVPIFGEFAKNAIGASGGRDFAIPDGVETVRVVAAPGHPAGLRCSGDPEVFLAGTGPYESCAPFGWVDTGGAVRSIGDWLRERRWWPGRDGRGDEEGEERILRLPPVGAPPPDARRIGEARR
jgi:penicillin-binding protein 1B